MRETHHTTLTVACFVLYIHSIVLSILATQQMQQTHSDTDVQPISPCFDINIVVNNDKWDLPTYSGFISDHAGTQSTTQIRIKPGAESYFVSEYRDINNNSVFTANKPNPSSSFDLNSTHVLSIYLSIYLAFYLTMQYSTRSTGCLYKLQQHKTWHPCS